jgi:hypothetical protein
MSRSKSLLILTALTLSLEVQAQTPDPPAHFASYGVTLRGGAAWLNLCTRTAAGVYACVATDFSNGTTSTRAGIEAIFLQMGSISLTVKADAGAATGASGSAGGSYGAGASLLCDLSKLAFSKHARFRNAFLVLSANWLKSDVNELFTNPLSGASTRSFASRGVYRFGFGHTF